MSIYIYIISEGLTDELRQRAAIRATYIYIIQLSALLYLLECLSWKNINKQSTYCPLKVKITQKYKPGRVYWSLFLEH